MSVGRAEQVVAKVVEAERTYVIPGIDVRGRIPVDGVPVEYRYRMLDDGTVNVGSIFPVK